MKKNSPFARFRESGAGAERRKRQVFEEEFSFCPVPGERRRGGKEKKAGFLRRLLLLSGAGNVAPRRKGEKGRIFKKIAPFIRCRMCAARAKRRKRQDFE